MVWTIHFHDLASRDMADLPIVLRARVLAILSRIETGGVTAVREPHVKHLEGKLWEVRAKGADGIARAIYIAVSGQRVVVLHAFVKKSQKTPAGALDIARRREKELGE